MTNKEMLGQINADILKTEQDVQSLRVRLATLKELRAKFTGAGRHKGRGVDSNSNNSLPGPGVAIRNLVLQGPGIDTEAVIQALRGKIKTKAVNQERLIRNTVANMIRDRLLTKNEDGGLEYAPLWEDGTTSS